jgi:DNA adenine methylase
MPQDVTVRAAPFLKWAGGKRQLLADYARLFPAGGTDATYHEPFLGSGAVFFHLFESGALRGRCVLSDLNAHLMTAWTIVRDRPEALATRLAELEEAHSEERYYAERERFNVEGLDALERAALVVYLNKAGFNGLYRVNKRGLFNVPAGRRAGGLNIPSLDALTACSRALKGCDLLAAPFASVLDRARPGDFAYFDPPYVPISETAFFTSYACEGFGMPEQELLRDVFAHLDRRGCRLMLSNSGSFEVLKLYQGFDVTRVQARRAINSDAGARGPVTEVVIRNYIN